MATNKSLQDTFIFRMLNGENRINNDLTKVMEKGIVLSPKNMEQEFLTIQKRYNYSLKNKVLDAVNKGEIVMMYSPDGVKLPTAIPFLLLKTANNQVKVIVLIDIHGNLNKDTMDVTIDPKKLYVTLEAALIALQHQKNLTSFRSRVSIIQTGANMYANMIARCLNRKYALNIDKTKLHKVQFIAAKFFIMNICQYENEALANEYASQVCVGANNLIMKDLAEATDPKYLTDLGTMIDFMKDPNLNIGLSDLTVRGFLEMYINMYHHSALLGLEMFPYFAYTINSVVHGAYINNQKSLEDIVEKVGPKFYITVAAATV